MKQELLALIAENQIQTVFDKLQHLDLQKINSNLPEIIITLSARYKRWNKKQLSGVLSNENSIIERTQIVNSLTQIVNELPDDVEIVKTNPSQKEMPKVHFNKSSDKKGLKLTCLITVLSSIVLPLFFFFYERPKARPIKFEIEINKNLEHSYSDKGTIKIIFNQDRDSMDRDLNESGIVDFGTIEPLKQGQSIRVIINKKGFRSLDTDFIYTTNKLPIKLEIHPDTINLELKSSSVRISPENTAIEPVPSKPKQEINYFAEIKLSLSLSEFDSVVVNTIPCAKVGSVVKCKNNIIKNTSNNIIIWNNGKSEILEQEFSKDHSEYQRLGNAFQKISN